MEGALASVVGGLTAAPVVAVPTSVGYGASLEGVTALLAMLALVRGRAHRGRHRQRLRRRLRRSLPASLDDVTAEPTRDTVAWFHCFSGIAGDMALGSLVDAGADLDEVRALVERLPVDGWQLEAEPVLRCGIAATKVARRTPRRPRSCAPPSHIAALVEEARLPDRVRRRALATFAALAEAEGRLHRRPPEQVHFHEVGGLDAIVDIVGTCAALEVLGVDVVVRLGGRHRHRDGARRPRAAAQPGAGGRRAARRRRRADLRHRRRRRAHHARPAPRCSPPWRRASGPMPAMTIEASGFGAGTRELDDRPNVTQVVIGDAERRGARRGQPVVLLEVNVDDATGETLAHTVAALLEAGAHDAWVTPIVMKKGRPAHTVRALADPALGAQVAEVLAARDRVARRARRHRRALAVRPRRPTRSRSTASPCG